MAAAARKLTITIPDTPHLQDARRRIDRVRDVTGRVATLAGTTTAAVVLVAPETGGHALLGTAAVTAGGLLTLRFGQPDGHQRATTSVLYLMPGVSLTVLLAAERIIGFHWGEIVALAVWTAATWAIRPARVARRMVSPTPPAPLPAPTTPQVMEEVFGDPIAAWWAQRVATANAAAPDTRLENIQTGDGTLRAVIRAVVDGDPVPTIAINRLSALMDIPEERISILPVPGRGAGVRQLTVRRTADQETDPLEIWNKTIAPKAMPGAIITGIKVGRPAHAPALDTPAPVAVAAAAPILIKEEL